MRNTTNNVGNRRDSKFLANRRKIFFVKRISKIGLRFLKVHKGKVTQSKIGQQSCRVTFKSITTGRTAFAYGSDFKAAYEKMIKLFYLKYAV